VLKFVLIATLALATSAAAQPSLERGDYLVNAVMACDGCHTPRAMADPKIKERIASLGGVALPGSPEDYGRTIAADTEKWAKVVQFSGAHVN